jgi:hypothetical protein
MGDDVLPIIKLADPPVPGEQFHFNPKYCCDHNWVFILTEQQRPTGQEYCRDCGATCLRDRRTGLIEEYDAVAGFGKKVTVDWKQRAKNTGPRGQGSFKKATHPFNHHPRPGRS